MIHPLIRLVAASTVLATAGAVGAAPLEYTIDPGHSQVHFTYSHLGFSNISGRFALQGRIIYDADNPEASSVETQVPIDSVSTGVPKLDEHLKADDFFDAAQHSTATFRSTRVTGSGGALDVHGDLSIHGVTLPVRFAVKVNTVGEHPMRKIPAAGFDATATIKRSDFDVGKYVPAVSDEVRIAVTVEALAAQPPDQSPQ